MVTVNRRLREKVYFIAWLFDVVVPLISSVLIALILCPPIRPLLFPAAPPALVDSGDASYDSITGAPERYKGEAAEQEARNLVNSVAGVAMESAAGKYGQGVVNEDQNTPQDQGPSQESQDALQVVPAGAPHSTPPDTPAPEPSPEAGPVVTTANAQTDGQGEDRTKQPMKKKVYEGTNKTMRVISDITDIYERFAK